MAARNPGSSPPHVLKKKTRILRSNAYRKQLAYRGADWFELLSTEKRSAALEGQIDDDDDERLEKGNIRGCGVEEDPFYEDPRNWPEIGKMDFLHSRVKIQIFKISSQ